MTQTQANKEHAAGYAMCKRITARIMEDMRVGLFDAMTAHRMVEEYRNEFMTGDSSDEYKTGYEVAYLDTPLFEVETFD